jgi:hypothetical protein
VLAALLLTGMFGLAAGAALDKSPVWDEGETVVRGWAFWRTGMLLAAERSPLAGLLSGAAVLLEPGLPAPSSLIGWQEGDTPRVAADLLWRSGADVTRLMLLARLPMIWLAMLLGALIWRWSRGVHGAWGALAALSVYALAPDVLAQAGLATPELSVAAFYVVALFGWERYSSTGRAAWLAVAGAGLGLALASGGAAPVLAPTLIVLSVLAVRRRGAFGGGRRVTARLGLALGGLAAVGLLGGAIVSLLHLLVQPPGDLTIQGLLPALPQPSPGVRPYLFGRFSDTGWWYGSRVVLATRLPLPAIGLLVFAATLALTGGLVRRDRDVLASLAVFVASSLVFPFGLEMRNLLPIVPLLALFAARCGAGRLRIRWLRPVVIFPLLAALLGAALVTYPDYLAFANPVMIRLSGSSYVFAASNLDRGQDLPALARYLQRRGAGQVYLSYFGEADPAYYGISAVVLPSAVSLPTASGTPPAPEPASLAMLNPPAGLYAISVANLAGVSPDIQDLYGYFRLRSPAARAGGSIYIYEVAPRPDEGDGAPWLAHCGPGSLPVRETSLADATGAADVQVFTFDCLSSLAWRDGPGWISLPAGAAPVVDLGPPDYSARTPDGLPSVNVWRSPRLPSAPANPIEFPAVRLPLPVAAQVDLLGYEASAGVIAPGDALQVTTWWRVRQPPTVPLVVSVVLLGPNDIPAARIDGLGVVSDTWQPGMIIVQQHSLALPDDLAEGPYRLTVALLSPLTGERLPVSRTGSRVIDRIVLRAVQVVAEP